MSILQRRSDDALGQPMTVSFLDFELIEECFELRWDGQSIAMQGRVFDLIAYLVRHRDRVVGKDELVREVWAANTASDTAISQVVKLARKALRDEGRTQRVIKTVRGRGFRFVAEVQGDERTPEPRTPARTRASLIGRNQELERLSRALANLRRGRGGLLLIEGEPGIGKTSLAEALATNALERGAFVSWGRAWEDGSASPFWPWIQVVRAMIERDGDAAVLRFMGRGQRELRELLPELHDRIGAPVHEPHGPHARFRSFDAMTQFLRNACLRSTPRTPRVFIFDDLHAMDEASIQLLRFVAPELEDMGLLVVGTFRDLELPGQRVLAQLAESVADEHRIQLRGLSRTEVCALVERKLGQIPSPAATDALHEHSAGNPLFLIEVSRRLDPSQPESWPLEVAQSAHCVPERILAAVRRQLAGLPKATVELLGTAAGLGREFSLPLLAAICACSESALMQHLEPALVRGLVVYTAGAPDQLRFAHAQVRRAIYAELPPNRRSPLHRRIVEQVAQVQGWSTPVQAAQTREDYQGLPTSRQNRVSSSTQPAIAKTC